MSKLKKRVARRARYRCEYCRMPEKFDPLPFTTDHVIAEKHRGPTTIHNLAYACSFCNAHKGTNIAGIDRKTRRIVPLFNPRKDRWHEHFRWVGARLIGSTPNGRATVDVLLINDPINVSARAHLIEEGEMW